MCKGLYIGILNLELGRRVGVIENLLDSEHIVLFMRSFMRFWECRGCGYDIVSINRNLIIWSYWNGIIRNRLDGYWKGSGTLGTMR